MNQLLTRVFLLCALSAVSAFAQATAGQGAISGTIRDASGAPVPGASVTVADQKKGINRELQSNDAGLFSAPGLAPAASYTVTVSKDGFTKYQANGVLLQVGHRVAITSLWSPTFSHGGGWLSRFLLNGWSISQITTLATPQPATATVNVATPLPGLYRTSSLNGLGASNRVPFLPLSSLNIDDVHRVDARLTKQLEFTERFKLDLYFEAFDVFNTISNTGVFTTAYMAANGVLTPNTQLGVGNASQGFPDGTNARRMQVGARFYF